MTDTSAVATPNLAFSALGLAEPILRAVADMGYTQMSPIQAKAIPVVLAGRDVMGAAQTGTGKTAAFTLPLLHRLSRGNLARSNAVRALVLTPTRELAAQVAEKVAEKQAAAAPVSRQSGSDAQSQGGQEQRVRRRPGLGLGRGRQGGQGPPISHARQQQHRHQGRLRHGRVRRALEPADAIRVRHAVVL